MLSLRTTAIMNDALPVVYRMLPRYSIPMFLISYLLIQFRDSLGTFARNILYLMRCFGVFMTGES